jgi:hypothetical protein
MEEPGRGFAVSPSASFLLAFRRRWSGRWGLQDSSPYPWAREKFARIRTSNLDSPVAGVDPSPRCPDETTNCICSTMHCSLPSTRQNNHETLSSLTFVSPKAMISISLGPVPLRFSSVFGGRAGPRAERCPLGMATSSSRLACAACSCRKHESALPTQPIMTADDPSSSLTEGELRRWPPQLKKHGSFETLS